MPQENNHEQQTADTQQSASTETEQQTNDGIEFAIGEQQQVDVETPTPEASNETPATPETTSKDETQQQPQGESQQQQQKTETDTETRSEHGDDAPARSKNKVTAKERISQLTKKYKDEHDQREAAENENAELKRRVAELEGKNARPNPENFESHEAYEEALVDWKIDQRQQAQQQANQQQGNQQQPAKITPEQRAVLDHVNQVVEEVSDKYPDFREKVFKPTNQGGPELTFEMTQAIFESDAGADIAYHLASNPQQAAQIAKLDQNSMLRAIGRLEVQMESASSSTASANNQQQTTTEQKTKPVSTTPEPFEPLGSGDARTKTTDDDDMNIDEYRSIMNQRYAKQGGVF